MRVLAFAVVSMLSSFAFAAPYHGFDVGGMGEHTSYANGINARGDIVGAVESDQHEFSAFVTRNGRLVLLDSLGGEQGDANAINDAGVIVGTAQLRNGRWHAFEYHPDGKLDDLGTLGGPGSVARAINQRGQVTGYSDTADGHWRGFVYENGAMTDIGTLGGRFSAPMAIGADGTVVGMAERTDGHRHAFVYTRATGMVDIGTLGGRHSAANGINRAGLVIGTSETADRSWHAFTWDGRTMRDLGPAIGNGNSYAQAVNNQGKIVGIYVDGYHRTFVYDGHETRFLDGEDSLYRPTAINDAGIIVGERYAGDHVKASLLIPDTRAVTVLPTRQIMLVLAALALFLVAVEARRQHGLGAF